MSACVGGYLATTAGHDRTLLACMVENVPALLNAADLERGPPETWTQHADLDRARLALHRTGSTLIDLYQSTIAYLGNENSPPPGGKPQPPRTALVLLDEAFMAWVWARADWAICLRREAGADAKCLADAATLLAKGRATRLHHAKGQGPCVDIYAVSA